MAIVPLDQVWVDANFKELQLAHMRVGQPVDADRRPLRRQGRRITARSSASAPAPGSAFALLPAQNATGNWIKIVQRVPVRIALDPQELAAHPLQIGLSMQVDVDTHDRGGARLPQIAQTDAGLRDRRLRLARRRRRRARAGDHRRQRSGAPSPARAARGDAMRAARRRVRRPRAFARHARCVPRKPHAHAAPA